MKRYPVNLDIQQQLCIVVGGGTVAKRKVEGLLPCGAKVVVISPELCPELQSRVEEGDVDWQQREYQRGDLQGAKLVFAATNSTATQKMVQEEADAAGVLVNVITDPKSCSFQVPAVIRQGALLITVATDGASPALAARIRKELTLQYGPEYAVLLDLMAAVRKEVVAACDNQHQHKQLFEKLLNSDILSFVREADWERLRETLEAILPPEMEVAALVKRLQSLENRPMETSPC